MGGLWVGEFSDHFDSYGSRRLVINSIFVVTVVFEDTPFLREQPGTPYVNDFGTLKWPRSRADSA